MLFSTEFPQRPIKNKLLIYANKKWLIVQHKVNIEINYEIINKMEEN